MIGALLAGFPIGATLIADAGDQGDTYTKATILATAPTTSVQSSPDDSEILSVGTKTSILVIRGDN